MNFEDFTWLFNCDNKNRKIIRVNFDEASVLWKASKNSSGDILEIGRKHGGSTVLLLASTYGTNRKIVSIDKKPEHHPDCEKFFQIEEIKNRLELFIGESNSFIAGERKFGIFFIDGDHSYKGIYSDVFHHWKSCINNSLIVFHDCDLGPIKNCIDKLLNFGCIAEMNEGGSVKVFKKLLELPREWETIKSNKIELEANKIKLEVDLANN